MIRIRNAGERGHANHGWLDTYHTFSFADYQDPEHMGFRKLRVINEDRVEPGQGFGTHAHRDMEIITYILEGTLEHKDSMGNGSAIRPGDVQRMSAGTGVTHSEFNHSKKEPVHLLQIWIFPEKKGIEPGYEQRQFSREERKNKLCLVASREPENGALKIHQDAKLYVSLLDKDAEVTHALKNNRYAWLQIAKGKVRLNGNILNQGDGAAVSEESLIKIVALEPSEFLLFDLA
jgi:redox-sensitive bicupin YhaK (pirin superfamily)